MTRRSFTALAVAIALTAKVWLFVGPPAAEAQCLDRAACREIRAEFTKLKPDLRVLRQQLKKARKALRALEIGSDPWLAKRVQLKRIKKAFRSLKRELRALQQDFRHQGCSSC